MNKSVVTEKLLKIEIISDMAARQI